MPFQRKHYPANWSDLAQAAKEAAGWRCARCGQQQGALAIGRNNQLYRIVLAACHLDHDPANPAPRLAVYCQACHLRYDALERWRSRRRKARRRALARGQLQWVTDEPPVG